MNWCMAKKEDTVSKQWQQFGRAALSAGGQIVFLKQEDKSIDSQPVCKEEPAWEGLG